MRYVFMSFFIVVGCTLFAADAPDGTQFTHPVLSVDGPDIVRIKFCGMPLQVKLATVQLKGETAEKGSLEYLKSTLKTGSMVRIELEPDAPADNSLQTKVHVFTGSTHVNLELVKRGLALSDGRSQKYSAALQSAQTDALSKKLGVWGEAATIASKTPNPPPSAPEIKPSIPEAEAAPPGYNGIVVADLNSKEYHFPGSRFAKSIRAGARIEYKSPEEAERAGKAPSPFSFPDRAKAIAEKASVASTGSASPDKIIDESKKVLQEALGYMGQARNLSRTDNNGANTYWKKAGKLLSAQLDKITPIADAAPDNKELQKLAEDMSMNLYSCNKYQSL